MVLATDAGLLVPAERGVRPLSGGSLAEISTLLVDWGVPGVQAPADITAAMAVRWSR